VPHHAGHAEPACTTWSEKTRVAGHPRPRGTTTTMPPRNSAMPPLTSPGPAFSRPRAHRRHPQQNPQLTTITAPATEIFPDRLTIIYLRWLCTGRENGSRSLATMQIGVICVRATREPALLAGARLVASDDQGATAVP
jgi:hypothetical protein